MALKEFPKEIYVKIVQGDGDEDGWLEASDTPGTLLEFAGDFETAGVYVLKETVKVSSPVKVSKR